MSEVLSDHMRSSSLNMLTLDSEKRLHGGEMMLSNIGFAELVFILAIALIIFGPNKLPEIGRAAGKTLREFKKTVSGVMDPQENMSSEERSRKDDYKQDEP